MRRNMSRLKAMISLYDFDLIKSIEFEEHINDLFFEVDDQFEYDEAFYKELVEGVIKNIIKIDNLISICLTNYTIDRLSYVDRSLIRIGTYEMLFTPTPKNIIINEIIELSKCYSETESYQTSKFNNALLDNIRKRIENVKR